MEYVKVGEVKVTTENEIRRSKGDNVKLCKNRKVFVPKLLKVMESSKLNLAKVFPSDDHALHA